MQLATASKLLLAMGVGSNTGSEPNAKRALDFSFPYIESLLETTLAEGSRVDYFNFYGKYEYRLEKGFVDADSVVVRESTDGLSLVGITDGSAVDPSDYYVDAERGVIVLRRAVLKGVHMFSVSYDHGLPESDDSAEVLVGPAWLEEAAVAAGLVVINTAPSVNATAKNKASGNKQVDELRLTLRQHIGNHLRPRMTVEYPSRSVDNG